MVCKIGNGASIFLWHDRWWGPDPLSKYISMNDVEQAGFDCNMKIKDMINEGQWSWSTEWSNSFPIVQSITVPTLLNDSNDRYLQCSNDGRCVKFSTNKTWKDWRPNGNKVEWCDLNWFYNFTPKHSFILWIAINGRLATQDRLLKWYPDRHMTCSLCDDCPDSLNHLFFECNYARRIWNDFKQRTEQDSMPGKWDDIVNFMVRQKINKSIKSILKRIGFAACVYYIWIERNRRIFSNEKRDASELIKTIVNYLRLKLSILKVKKIAQVEMSARSGKW